MMRAATTGFALATFLTLFAADDLAAADTPEGRAIAYLSAEVPKWAREHHCYSCHNNGDAARALFVARQAGQLADPAPLADTLKFLSQPKTWDANGPDGPFKDRDLQRIQFAAALVAAKTSGLEVDPTALVEAARLLAELQHGSGAWRDDSLELIGSPTTYGPHLSSAVAVRTLAAIDANAHRTAIDRARRWFEQTQVKNIVTAAATGLALAGVPGDAADAQRRRALQLIVDAQSADGGWGPYTSSPSEVFDTALVLVCLAEQAGQDFNKQIEKGRAYLIVHQAADGSWPATTRPSGNESYAQQISTTGWATQALLATRPAAPGQPKRPLIEPKR